MGLIITLILAGIILILAEIFLIPGIGIAGFLGVLSLCGSSWYAFAYMSSLTGSIVTIFNVVLMTVLLIYAFRAKTWKKLELSTVIDNAESEEKVGVGDRGKTVTRLGPMGTARIGNKNYEVTAFEGMIDAGTPVEVVHIENNKIYVKVIMPDEAF